MSLRAWAVRLPVGASLFDGAVRLRIVILPPKATRFKGQYSLNLRHRNMGAKRQAVQ